MFIKKNANILLKFLLQRISKKYVEKYWKGISNPIFLRFPNGVEQKIFWKESNGDVCFVKNWENFAKPLKCGSLLTFKHTGGPYKTSSLADLLMYKINRIFPIYTRVA
jgi:hypothetical protein